MEAETQTLIALRLGYATEAAAADVISIAAEIGRMINGLRDHLKAEAKKRAASSDAS